MEGRVLLSCAECEVTREVSGELPDEYIACFERAVHEEGWAPRPGSAEALVCRECLRKYEGHETVDDQEKVRDGV